MIDWQKRFSRLSSNYENQQARLHAAEGRIAELEAKLRDRVIRDVDDFINARAATFVAERDNARAWAHRWKLLAKRLRARCETEEHTHVFDRLTL